MVLSSFSSTVANCLLTSCTDNVCRIWCESIKQGDHNASPSHPTKNHHRCMWHLSQQPKKPVAKDDTAEDPLLRYQLPSALQFHIAVAVNALNDIPILSSLDSISSSNHSSFVLHWLNNKEIQFTMAAESCLGAPVLALEVESIDISDDSSNSDSEAELLVPSDEEFPESYKRKNQLDNTLGRVAIISRRRELPSDLFTEKGSTQRIRFQCISIFCLQCSLSSVGCRNRLVHFLP